MVPDQSAQKRASGSPDRGVVGPEYKTLKEMEETLMKTLKLQQDLQQFNISVRA